MNITLRIARWVLALGISAALSLWIFLATLNATAANRDVVKGWLASSGVYDKALDSLLRVTTDTSQDPLVRGAAQQAFVQTFEGTFVRESTETALNASYDWLEGKTNAITFAIPIQEKETEFYANMAAVLVPKLQALPACPTRIPVSTTTITCLPQGVDATSYANQLARPAGSEKFLNEPLTQEAISNQIQPVPWLPGALQWLHIGLWALPLAAFIFSSLYVLASPERLRAVSQVARRLTVGAALTLIGGAFMWYASSAINMSSAVDANDPDQVAQQQAIVNNIMNPLARTVLPSIGQALTLYSGIVVAIAGSTWLGVFIWRHKRGSGTPTPPPYSTSGPQVPPPPANPQEVHLPPPAARL